MRTLHLSFHDDMPHVWGELSDAQPKRRTSGAVAWHPRAARTRDLADAIESLGLAVHSPGAKRQPTIVWLPAAGDVPVPSTPLLNGSIDRRRRITLAPFRVETLPLELDDVLVLAAALAADDQAARAFAPSPSFQWTDRFIRMIMGVVAREQILPGLQRGVKGWESCWLPYPDEETQAALVAHAERMPAVCRCMTPPAEAAPTIAPAAMCRRLEQRFTDRIVRWSLEQLDRPHPASGRHASIHDAWLASLAAAPAVAWPVEQDLVAFDTQLRQWARRVHLLARSPHAFCLRVAEPEPGRTTSQWTIDYLLRSKSDPSLLLPLDVVWNQKSMPADMRAHFGGDGLEFALLALGQAAALSPPIARSLESPHPACATCDGDALLRFLTVEADVLRQAGFDVRVPAWWTQRTRTRQSISLTVRATTPQMDAARGVSLDLAHSFDLGVALDGDEVSLEELRRLARHKSSIVEFRGKWTVVDHEAIARAVRTVERQMNGTLSGRELVHMALGAERRIGDLAIGTVSVTGWLGELIEGLKNREEWSLLPQPERFNGTLRPYQLRGFAWLAFLRRWHLGGCLADDMGLGKTVQTLAFMLHERNAGDQRPVLLVCPTSVMNNWSREAAVFTPDLPVLVHHGSTRMKRDGFLAEVERHAIVVCSYGLLQRDIDFLSQVDWAGAIFDEAQFIKNPDTRQAKAARAIRAGYRFALTGTPVENHVGDLWSVMDLLNPGLLGTRSGFRTSFLRPIHMYGDAARAERLKSLTAPFILRRMKTDRSIISDLPDKLEAIEYCSLTREQASLYQAVLDKMERQIAQSSGMERRGIVLATLLRLKQICNHPALFLGDGSQLEGRSGKLARLEEMLTDIRARGERTLVFTQFAEMGGALQSWVRTRFREEVFFLHGATPRAQRDDMVQRFQHDAHAPHVFVLSLKAGGTGLTLTRANHVVHFDRWWNPAVETQATDRAFRIGQTRDVYVRTCVVAGTLEDRIHAMIESKRAIAASVVGTGEQWLTELSNDELFSLFRLGDDATGGDE